MADNVLKIEYKLYLEAEDVSQSRILSSASYLENVLHNVFGLKDAMDRIGSDDTDEKTILRNIIIAVAHKAYLNKCLAILNAHHDTLP